MNGIVKKWDCTRGYGLIAPLVGDPNAALVFVHRTSVPGLKRDGNLPIGAEVSFTLVRGDRGPQAASVELIPINGSTLKAQPTTP
jgi:cold shock CspA family protein